jgi:hypothetical protein
VAVDAIFESITQCRLCAAQDLTEVLNLGNHPPANALVLVGDREPPLIPLRLMFCQACASIQLGESVDPHFLFSKYVWVTGTSRTAVEYSRRFVVEALKRCHQKTPFVVEIASNDGTFLRRFQEGGSRVLGIDPAENLAEVAVACGLPTSVRFFTKEVAEDVLGTHGYADIVVARNVIPHVKEIHSVIHGIATLLEPTGTGIIEFHDTTLILNELQYDYIYHEHLFYYSLASIGKLLCQYGLAVYDVERSPISGGSWVIYFSKASREKTQALKDAELQELNSGVNSLEHWLGFGAKANDHRTRLTAIVRGSLGPIVAYGASARSSTLVNYCGFGCQDISSIIDKNPLKQGLLAPGSKIPVISYVEGEKLLDSQERILLLAWNFGEEVISDLKVSGYQGRFIIPFPGEPRIQ